MKILQAIKAKKGQALVLGNEEMVISKVSAMDFLCAAHYVHV